MYNLSYVVGLLYNDYGANIGPVPMEEKCSQFGQRDFSALNEIETEVFFHMLKSLYPLTKFKRVKSFTDDEQGNKCKYYEIEVFENENFEMPDYWTPEAYTMLLERCRDAGLWHPSFKEVDRMTVSSNLKRQTAAQ